MLECVRNSDKNSERLWGLIWWSIDKSQWKQSWSWCVSGDSPTPVVKSDISRDAIS